jgi:hypothetical protein
MADLWDVILIFCISYQGIFLSGNPDLFVGESLQGIGVIEKNGE